jgi:hypothetical protein
VLSINAGASGAVELRPPQSPLERISTDAVLQPFVEFRFNPSKSKGDFSVTMASLSRRLFLNESVGDGLSIQFSRDDCSVGHDCYALIQLPILDDKFLVLERVSQENPSKNISGRCFYGTIDTFTLACGGDRELQYTCDGSWSGKFELFCPIVSVLSSCGLVSVGGADNVGSCQLIDFSSLAITCNCSFTTTSAMRPVVSTPYIVPKLSLHEESTDPRIEAETAISAPGASANYGGVVVMSTMFALSLLIAAIGSYRSSHRVSALDEKGVATEDGASNRHVLEPPLVFMRDGSSSALLGYALSRRHAWFGIQQFRPKDGSAFAGSVFNAMFINTAMFSNAFLYLLAKDCGGYHDNTSCDGYSMVFMQSTCVWDGSAGLCESKNLSVDIRLIVWIAVLSTVVAAILSYMVEALAANILSAKPGKAASNAVKFEALSRISADRQMAARRMSQNSLELQMNKNVINLAQECVNARDSLTANSDIQIFFGESWGLNKLGMPHIIQEAIRKDMDHVWELAQRESSILHASTMQQNSLQEIDMRLSQLFVNDLLSDAACQAVRPWQRAYPCANGSIEWWKKVLAGCCVAASCMGCFGFVIYNLLLASNDIAQWAFVLSFLITLGLDIVVSSSLSVYITYIYLPTLFSSEVLEAYRRAKDLLFSAKSESPSNHAWSRSERFDATKYLFVSREVSRKYPSSAISWRISEYTSPWPRKHYSMSVLGGLGFFYNSIHVCVRASMHTRSMFVRLLVAGILLISQGVALVVPLNLSVLTGILIVVGLVCAIRIATVALRTHMNNIIQKVLLFQNEPLVEDAFISKLRRRYSTSATAVVQLLVCAEDLDNSDDAINDTDRSCENAIDSSDAKDHHSDGDSNAMNVSPLDSCSEDASDLSTPSLASIKSSATSFHSNKSSSSSESIDFSLDFEERV